MKRYAVIVGRNIRVMSVYAESEEEAIEKAEHQLVGHEGREAIGRRWVREGRRVKEM